MISINQSLISVFNYHCKITNKVVQAID